VKDLVLSLQKRQRCFVIPAVFRKNFPRHNTVIQSSLFRGWNKR